MIVVTAEKHDLSMFEELNQKKQPWEKRMKVIRERFPSVDNLDYKKAFDEDLDLFARIVRDILKIDQASPGRPGPRPSLDQGQATRRMRQFLGQDYSILPFPEAFRILAGGRSIRQLVVKTGLSRNSIHRLLRGELDPDAYVMEEVARAFSKSPAYFLEYRQMVITKALLQRMEYSPESTIGIYRKITRQEKDAS